MHQKKYLHMKTLRLILGDQLNINHSWFEKTDKNVVYLMAEMRQETNYVKHHIQKVVAFFLSMRSFAADLKSKNHQEIGRASCRERVYCVV